MKLTIMTSASALALATVLASGAPSSAQEFIIPGKYERPLRTGTGKRDHTRAYIGLSWSFGARATGQPSVVVGVQSIRVRSSNSLRGIDVNARFNFTDGFERVAIAGLLGRRDVYANLGGGFNIRDGEPFVTAAVQGPFLRAGLDVGINSGNWAPYVEINTLERPRRVQNGELTCPEGYMLTSPFFDTPDDLVVDGQTCADMLWFD